MNDQTNLKLGFSTHPAPSGESRLNCSHQQPKVASKSADFLDPRFCYFSVSSFYLETGNLERFH